MASGFHWVLAIICNPKDAVDSNHNPSIRPEILILDSLGANQTINELYTAYSTSIDKMFDFINALWKPRTNGYECGLFVLHYIHLFCKELDPSRITSEWFDPISCKQMPRNLAADILF